MTKKLDEGRAPTPLANCGEEKKRLEAAAPVTQAPERRCYCGIIIAKASRLCTESDCPYR